MNQRIKLPFLHLILLCFLCLFLTGFFGSCKSHKKSENTKIEDVLSIKSKKTTSPQKREKIIKEAKTWIGTPYKYAHQEKGQGTDCSGMVMVIYDEVAKIKLPRNSAKQAEFCYEIKKKEILPGDLVFFATGKNKNQVSHVGIMIDQENFIHASSSKGVTISTMTTPYYQRTFINYGRVPSMNDKK